MDGRTLGVLEHPIQKRPSIQQNTIQYKQKHGTIWLGSWLYQFQTHVGCKCKSPGDGWAMARWLPLAISKVCGCIFRSLQDGLEMTGWLAPTN